MAALPYIPLYVADYLADTAHLSVAEHGAYLLLIMNYWQRGKPLPALNDRLARVARMSNEEWNRARPVLAEFFREVDGEWVHDRIERELAKATRKAGTGRRPPIEVWSILRAAVFARDDYACGYCGERGAKLECDHVVPVSRGGSNDLTNLLTACLACNRSKSNKLLAEWGR